MRAHVDFFFAVYFFNPIGLEGEEKKTRGDTSASVRIVVRFDNDRRCPTTEISRV